MEIVEVENLSRRNWINMLIGTVKFKVGLFSRLVGELILEIILVYWTIYLIKLDLVELCGRN